MRARPLLSLVGKTLVALALLLSGAASAQELADPDFSGKLTYRTPSPSNTIDYTISDNETAGGPAVAAYLLKVNGVTVTGGTCGGGASMSLVQGGLGCQGPSWGPGGTLTGTLTVDQAPALNAGGVLGVLQGLTQRDFVLTGPKVAQGKPELTISKTVFPNPVTVGNEVTFTITVTNRSKSVEAKDVEIGDVSFGSDVTSASSTKGTCKKTDLGGKCNVPSLAPGESVVVTVKATAGKVQPETGNGAFATSPDSGFTFAVAWNDILPPCGQESVFCGGPRNDKLKGGPKGATIDGKGGNDEISGGKGKDQLFGNAGNDRLNGGGGNDFLDSGEGSDDLNGGSGRDICIGNLRTRFRNCEQSWIAPQAAGCDVGIAPSSTSGTDTVFAGDCKTSKVQEVRIVLRAPAPSIGSVSVERTDGSFAPASCSGIMTKLLVCKPTSGVLAAGDRLVVDGVPASSVPPLPGPSKNLFKIGSVNGALVIIVSP